MQPKTLEKVCLPEKYHILADEFQNIMFKHETFTLLPIFKKASSLLALSGSPLQSEHVKFIQKAMEGSLVTSFEDQNPYGCEEGETFICNTPLQQLKKVAQIAKEKREKAPVLIIMEEEQGIAYMKLSEITRGDTTLLYGE